MCENGFGMRSPQHRNVVTGLNGHLPSAVTEGAPMSRITGFFATERIPERQSLAALASTCGRREVLLYRVEALGRPFRSTSCVTAAFTPSFSFAA